MARKYEDTQKLREGKSTDELVAIIEDLDTKLSEAEEKAPVDPPADPPADPEKPADPPADSPADPPAQGGETKEMSETIKAMKAENADIKKELAEVREERRQVAIEKKLFELEKAGMPPVVLEQMKALMLADKTGNTIKLSEKTKDGKVTESTLTLSDAVVKLAQSIPLVGLDEISLSEDGESSDLQPEQNTEKTDIQKVRQFAEEKKIPFRQAMIQLAEKGEVKIPNYASRIPQE